MGCSARQIVALLLALWCVGCVGGDPGVPSRAPALEALAPPSIETVLRLPEPWTARSIHTSGPGFYAISARDEEITISLHASDVVHHPGDGTRGPERVHAVRGRPALVLVNEGIRSVTWEEGRTSYVLEVECYHPFEDPRCTEERFVLELANGLREVRR